MPLEQLEKEAYTFIERTLGNEIRFRTMQKTRWTNLERESFRKRRPLVKQDHLYKPSAATVKRGRKGTLLVRREEHPLRRLELKAYRYRTAGTRNRMNNI